MHVQAVNFSQVLKHYHCTFNNFVVVIVEFRFLPCVCKNEADVCSID